MKMTEKSLYLAGTWTTGEGSPFTSYNPADGSLVWQGCSASPSQIEIAIQSAQLALPSWSTLTALDRYEALKTYHFSLQQHQHELAQLLSQENGKPLWEAELEINSVLDKFAISYTAYQERCPQRCLPTPQATSITRHKPHGVLAVLGPFNLPAHLPHGHIIPALLAGNTVVFKPSELTPAIAESMLRCWDSCNLPPGVLNLIQGGSNVGSHLATHPSIHGLLFTGSWHTGQLLQTASLPFPGRMVALEMGGNNPIVVWKSHDLITTARLILQSAFITSGQRCSCARRLILSSGSEGDALLNILTSLTKRLTIGPYYQLPQPFIGPLINVQAAQHVYNRYIDLKQQGAVTLTRMQRHSAGAAFLSPGIIDVTPIPLTERDDEEIFGPLLQVIRIASFQEAIQVANATTYGLAAGIFTDDPLLYTSFWQQIRAGIINWNTPLTGASSKAPFGGIGRSGNCHPSAYYAADYSTYPVASQETPLPQASAMPLPGIPEL